MAIASNSWSGVVSAAGVDVAVGTAVTLDATGALVPATTANIAASPSGVIEGIAVTPGSPRSGIIVFEAGRLEPSQVPMVGTGAVEFAVVAADGSIVRSATYTAQAIGIAAKDGSVSIMLSLFGGLISGGGGGSVNIATVAVNIAAGDGLVTANHPTDYTRQTLASTANMALGFLLTGIALTSALALGFVVYAAPGTTVPASLLGLSPTGVASWAVLDAGGQPVRKKNPVPSDVFCGVIDQRGNLLVASTRFELSALDVGLPPYSADPTGVSGTSDAIRQAVIDANIAGGAMQLNFASKEVRVPAGLWLVDKPIHVKTPACRIRGEGRLTSHLRATTFIGPLLHIAPDIGAFPTVANSGIGGGNALVIARNAQVQNEHWFEISECGAGGDYNGLGAISVEMLVTPSNTTLPGSALFFQSFGDRLLSDGTDVEAIGIGYSGASGAFTTNAFYFTLTTGTGTTTIFAASNSSPIGAQVFLQCIYDGATMKIYVNGVQQATQGKTGNIVQGSWETVNFNGSYSYYLANRKYSSADVLIASFKVSATAQTPRTISAKLTEDANTICLINADLFDGVFLKARARPTKTANACLDAYYIHRLDNVGQVGGMVDCMVEDICLTNLYGTAVNCNSAFNIACNYITVFAKNGFRFDNNCFKASAQNLYITSTNNDLTGLNARVGISVTGAANVISLGNVYVSGFDTNLLFNAGGDVGTWGSWYSTVSKLHCYFIGLYNVTWNAESEISDEASTGTKIPDSFISFNGCDRVVWINYQPSQGGSAGSCPLMTIQGNTIFGKNVYTFVSPYMKTDVGTGRVSFLGSPDCTLKLVDPLIFGTSTNIVRGAQPASAAIISYPHIDNVAIAVPISDANYTVTAEQWIRGILNVTGTLTATRTFTAPAAINGKHWISNATGQTLNILAAGGATPVACANGKTVCVISDGAEMKLLSTT